MTMLPTFYVSLVQRWSPVRVPGQEDEDLPVNNGRVIERTDKHQDVVEWKFNEILDFGKADNGRW
jgi:hypothetical protein